MTTTETIVYITKKNNKSPGPSEYEQQSTIGRDCPKFTISGKIEPKERNDQDDKGIGYQVIPSSVGNGPKYSLRGRPKEAKQEQTPGPSYVPPAFGKDAKTSAFHIKREPKGKNEKTSPGPGEYAVPSTIGAGKKFSMKGRVFPPEMGESAGPGPAEYNPEFDAVMPKVQQSSMHIRPAERKQKDTGPGPGLYSIPSTLNQNPVSFHKRTEQHIDKISPGPAKYNYDPQIGSDARKYTMRSRIDVKKDVLSVPYYVLESTIGQGRKSTLHGRPKDAKIESSPGPDFMPPSFGSDSHKFSFGNRRDISKRSTSASVPGPGEYDVGTTIGKGLKFSLKGREKIPEEKDINPGPAAYAPNYDKLLAARESKIGARIEVKKEVIGGKYYKLPDPDRGPMYTIGRKSNLDVAPGAK